MSEKTAGELRLEELAKEFADMTATEAELGFSDKFSDYREPLAQVTIYKKAEIDALVKFDGKTSKEIKTEAKEKFHKKTRNKLIMEGETVPPEYDDTVTNTELEEKGLNTIIEDATPGTTVNLPETTIEDPVTLKDGVKLEGVSAPAGENPRQGETVIAGEIVPETTMSISGVTLTGTAFDSNFSDLEEAEIDNSRILNLTSAN